MQETISYGPSLVPGDRAMNERHYIVQCDAGAEPALRRGKLLEITDPIDKR